MKILLDLQGAQTASRLRGIGRQTLSLAKAIIANPRRHDIRVMLNGGLEHSCAELRDDLAALLPADRITSFRYVGAVAERDAGNLWRTQAAERLREAEIARLEPDLVHISSLFEGYVDDAVTSIGHFRTAAVTAVTLHDLTPLADPDRCLGEEGPRRHWLRRAQSLKRADLLVSVSEAARRDAIDRLHIAGGRIAVISAGVDARFRPDPEDGGAGARLRAAYALDSPFLLHVGAVGPRKNVGLLLQAFAKLPDATRGRHRIVFAGHISDAEVARLRREAAAEGVPIDALRFCGHVSDDDLVALYQRCKAFVVPSRSEGFGLPVVEAMACGAAVLAARATSLPEIVGNDALLFDPDDPNELAAKLRVVLDSPEARERAGAWGIERSASFTWSESARRTLDAFEDAETRFAKPRGSAPGIVRAGRIAAKPRLAFLSPLPPDASGIAAGGAALLRELGRFYDIDCVTTASGCNDLWVLANFAIRDIGFFERNAPRYDRIVYSVGSSRSHAHMPGLLERFPGVVILHDFVLSDLVSWMDGSGLLPGDGFARELYRTHGLRALLEEREAGRIAAVERFACNGMVFRAALGVIVHSASESEQARRLFGPAVVDRVAVLPRLKAVPVAVDRRAARARLDFAEGDLLVCSFGVVACRDLVEGWLASSTGRHFGARLILVGRVSDGEDLTSLIQTAGQDATIIFAGQADTFAYRDYLAAADIAVQLGKASRGETSDAVLDCLAHGLPVIVDAQGSGAEYPDSVLVRLPEPLSANGLAEAIDRLAADPHRRAALENAARAHVRRRHDPGRLGEQFFTAIERMSTGEPEQEERTLLGAITAIAAPVSPVHADLQSVAEAIATARPALEQPQLLYDVTVLAAHDARTGIQRVVRAMLQQLTSRDLGGYRIEPVRMDGTGLRYARRFASQVFGVSTGLDDDLCPGRAGDLYLSIDWVPDRLPVLEPWLADFRRRGGRVVIGVHDLLPLELPQFFPEDMPALTQRWFEACLRVADGFVCVSAAVADEVVRRGSALIRDRQRSIAVEVVHNAGDLESSLPSKGRPANAAGVLAALAARPTFLMVGTVEPRKGHLQVLSGFDLLWQQGFDVGLLIVGKKGWMLDGFEDRVAGHRETGQRLRWLRGISDEYLRDLYAASAALIAASEGEGFGLPLIEAGRLGTPLIARDLPVFREVADGRALFFGGREPRQIAEAVKKWLGLRRDGRTPSPDGIRIKSWAQSADDLVSVLFSGRPAGRVIAPRRASQQTPVDALG